MEFEIIEDVSVNNLKGIGDLMKAYGKIHGFGASDIYNAYEILKEIITKSDLRFISFTANIVATGIRGLIADLINRKAFNVVITTGGTIDHDIARSLGGKYIKGSFDSNDVELKQRGLHRLGNVFIEFGDYGLKIENFVKEKIGNWSNKKKIWGVYEILWEVGKEIKDEKSILRNAFLNNIPIFVPGIYDSSFGTNLFIYSQFTPLILDYQIDMKKISELIFSSKTSGALILGGGISKHHVIWWNQFKDGLDYSVYISTADEHDGSLSGARTREAISWNKIKYSARRADLKCDVTIALPILIAALKGDGII
jgi:deoxyhypusine synthase